MGTIRSGIALALGIAVGLSACANDSNGAITPTTTGGTFDIGDVEFVAALTAFERCEDLGDYLKSSALEQVTPWGLGGYAMPYLADGLEVTTRAGGSQDVATDSFDAPAVPPSGAPSTAAAESSNRSSEGGDTASALGTGTNNQEAGVDEADIVKVDGDRVITLRNNQLIVARIEGGVPRRTATVDLGDVYGQQLFVTRGRAFVTASTMGFYQGGPTPATDMIEPGIASRSSYMAQPSASVLIEVSLGESPAVVHRSTITGSVMDGRLVAGTARFIMSSPGGAQLPFVQPGLPVDPAPTTIVPDTSVPDTTIPDTTIPDDTIPDITVPDDTVPDDTVPDITAPATLAPDTTTPDTTVANSTGSSGSEPGSSGASEPLIAVEPFDPAYPYPVDPTEPVDPNQPVHTEQSALAANRAVIENSTLDQWVPAISVDGGTAQPLVDCDSMFRPAEPSGLSILSILTIADDLPSLTATGLVAETGITYGSADHLYIATNRWISPDVSPATDSGDSSSADDTVTSSNAVTGAQYTDIHSFATTGAEPAAYEASGRVEGTTLNQYSMSQSGDILRVATTTNSGSINNETPSQSGIVTLRREGQTLRQVGKVDGLGVTEQIQSVRYVGDYAYVVTFRQTDPFYVIDLSDPTKPRTLGELKVPGFSSYLHPVGDGLALGVGSDADDEGRITGAKVSLYDTSDPTAPREVTTRTFTDIDFLAGSDPKSFHWDAERRTVYLPYYVSCWGEDYEACQSQRNGVLVATVDDESITERGRISHADSQWTSISRVFVMGSDVVTLGDTGLGVANVDTLDTTGLLGFDG